EVRHQMSRGLELDWKREVAPPDAGQQFFASLNGPLGPAMLLRLETVHIHRQLGRSDHVGQINKFPARELRAIAKVEVLAQRISLPASTLFDTRTPPETGGSVKVEKTAAAAAGGLLKQKVSIQKDRLHAREQRIPTIQMAPASLDHPYFWISKKMDGTSKQIFLRDEISVEDTKEFSFRSVESCRQGAGLESCAINSMNKLNIKAMLAQFFRARGGDLASLVG